MDKSVSTFEKHREQLFNIAYGMLGRVTSVEDVVQEAYLRWRKVEVDKIDSPMAYISTIVSRICLDQLKSAHNRKESYVGPICPNHCWSRTGPARRRKLSWLSPSRWLCWWS